ncbi:MAG: hypothetical protein NC319_02695 [Butyricicoccus sp.]|nr:hypothetical protein [Butyricicoccus sp.]
MGRMKYGRGAVYGSLAYDYDNPELYPEEYSSAPEPAAPPQTRERAQTATRAQVQARSRQAVYPLAMLGIAVAAVLFVIAIMAQIQLFDISSKTVELQTQLKELQTEQTKLKIAYEGAFNLTEIEQYATSRLGMQKPSADQIYYIDTSLPDRAVIIAQTASNGFFGRMSDLLSEIGAYFR